MKVLITGASSGIGLEIAKILKDNDLYVVSRNKEELKKIYKDFPNVTCLGLDLSQEDNVQKLVATVADIDVLINNAGFGDCGEFSKTSLSKELNMIDVNIKAYHLLMKSYLDKFIFKDKGYILNVGSIAGFMPGPYMATYYATKSYINSLTLSIYMELKRTKSHVHISLFAPGPVTTNFNNRAHVKFNVGSISSTKAAKIAITGLFKNKPIIIPSNMKCLYFFSKISPILLVTYINSYVQERKM